MKLLLAKAELAEALGGLSPRRFDELRPSLEARGFPRPIPGLGARWSLAAVAHWIAASQIAGAASSPAPGQAGGGVPVPPPATVAALRDRLERRYGGSHV